VLRTAGLKAAHHLVNMPHAVGHLPRRHTSHLLSPSRWLGSY
jgi:hypothetical protein